MASQPAKAPCYNDAFIASEDAFSYTRSSTTCSAPSAKVNVLSASDWVNNSSPWACHRADFSLSNTLFGPSLCRHRLGPCVVIAAKCRYTDLMQKSRTQCHTQDNGERHKCVTAVRARRLGGLVVWQCCFETAIAMSGNEEGTRYRRNGQGDTQSTIGHGCRRRFSVLGQAQAFFCHELGCWPSETKRRAVEGEKWVMQEI